MIAPSASTLSIALPAPASKTATPARQGASGFGEALSKASCTGKKADQADAGSHSKAVAGEAGPRGRSSESGTEESKERQLQTGATKRSSVDDDDQGTPDGTQVDVGSKFPHHHLVRVMLEGITLQNQSDAPDGEVADARPANPVASRQGRPVVVANAMPQNAESIGGALKDQLTSSASVAPLAAAGEAQAAAKGETARGEARRSDNAPAYGLDIGSDRRAGVSEFASFQGRLASGRSAGDDSAKTGETLPPRDGKITGLANALSRSDGPSAAGNGEKGGVDGKAVPANSSASAPAEVRTPVNSAPRADRSVNADTDTQAPKVHPVGNPRGPDGAGTAAAASVQAAATSALNDGSGRSSAPPPSRQVAEALGRELADLSAGRISLSGRPGAGGDTVKTMRLQLNPAELGPVHIRIQSVGGELRLTIRAESDRTANLISQDSDAIRAALRHAGGSSTDLTIAAHRHEAGSQPQANGDQGRGAQNQQFNGQESREQTSGDPRQSFREGRSDGNPQRISRGDESDGGAAGDLDRVLI